MTALIREADTDSTPNLHTDIELCRLTVVAPRTRMDLALPVDATLADVLPTLLRHAGEDPNDPAFLRGGWSLQRLGGPPLDTARRLSAAGIRDGDVLYLRHRDAALPELAFDDVADATTAATRRDGRGAWTSATTKLASVLFGGVFAVGAAAALVSTGPSWVVPSAVLLTAAALAIGLAAACARSFGSPDAGLAVAGVAVTFGFLGGVVLTAGSGGWRSGGASALLVGSAIALVLAGLAILAVGKGQYGFIGVLASASVGVVAAGARTLDVGGVAAVAAITTVVLLAGTPLLPALAARIARLPMPVLPLSADDIRHATDVMPGRDVLERARAADRVFSSLTAASAVTVAVCSGWVVDGGSWYGATLVAVTGIALWLRARHFTARQQRSWLLCAGAVCRGLAAQTLSNGGSTAVHVLVPVVLLLGAVLALVWGMWMAGRRLTPYWGRLGDVLEVLVCCRSCRSPSASRAPTPRCRTSSGRSHRQTRCWRVQRRRPTRTAATTSTAEATPIAMVRVVMRFPTAPARSLSRAASYVSCTCSPAASTRSRPSAARCAADSLARPVTSAFAVSASTVAARSARIRSTSAWAWSTLPAEEVVVSLLIGARAPSAR